MVTSPVGSVEIVQVAAAGADAVEIPEACKSSGCAWRVMDSKELPSPKGASENGGDSTGRASSVMASTHVSRSRTEVGSQSSSGTAAVVLLSPRGSLSVTMRCDDIESYTSCGDEQVGAGVVVVAVAVGEEPEALELGT